MVPRPSYLCHEDPYTIGIPIIKMRLFYNHLIFIMVNSIPGNSFFILKNGPGMLSHPRLSQYHTSSVPKLSHACPGAVCNWCALLQPNAINPYGWHRGWVPVSVTMATIWRQQWVDQLGVSLSWINNHLRFRDLAQELGTKGLSCDLKR